MQTAGEIITDVIQFYLNIAPEQQFTQADARLRAAKFLRETMTYAWNYAPFSFRHGTGVITAEYVDDGVFTCPTDFSGAGTQTRVLCLQAQPYELTYMEEGALKALHTMRPTTSNTPINYTWTRATNAGLHQGQIWPAPQPDQSIKLESYNRRCLDPIDFPGKPQVEDLATAGNLVGTYYWRATYVWGTDDDETEGGFISEALVVPLIVTTGSQVEVQVKPSPSRYVSAINIYRTGNGDFNFKLSGQILNKANNVEGYAVYTDNVADVALADNCPFPSEAVTGVEQFPDDFNELVLYEGTKAKMAGSQGDMRDAGFSLEFKKNVKYMWAEQKPGQNVAFGMPAYGSVGNNGYNWRQRLVGN